MYDRLPVPSLRMITQIKHQRLIMLRKRVAGKRPGSQQKEDKAKIIFNQINEVAEKIHGIGKKRKTAMLIFNLLPHLIVEFSLWQIPGTFMPKLSNVNYFSWGFL